MKRLVCILIFAVVSSLLMQSCTVHKRKHMPGWFISTKKVGHSSSENVKDKTPQSVVRSDLNQAETIIESNSIDSNPESLKPIIDKDPQAIETNSVIEQISSRSPQSNELTIQHRQSIPDREEVPRTKTLQDEKRMKEPWIGKFLGGFLGILLALISLPPMFLIVFFLFDGDTDDLFEFSESSEDSFFVRSFKKCFNAVFKIGVQVLVIAAIVLGLAVFLWFLYLEFGLGAVLIAIVVIALLMWVMALLAEAFLQFILPGY